MKSAVPRYLFALTMATGALALVLLLFSAPLPAQGATVTLDGLPDPAYGPALAADPPGDLASPAGAAGLVRHPPGLRYSLRCYDKGERCNQDSGPAGITRYQTG